MVTNINTLFNKYMCCVPLCGYKFSNGGIPVICETKKYGMSCSRYSLYPPWSANIK